MTRAYSESYLSDAKDRLSQFFDYLIKDCGMKAGQPGHPRRHVRH